MNRSTCTREVNLIAIGNSKGIRLPKALLDRYGWSDALILEQLEDAVVLRCKGGNKLSSEETYRAMAAESEDWSTFDIAMAEDVE